MSYSEIFELRRQIHELRTDAAIMKTALRAYEDIIEEHNDTIEPGLKLYVWEDFCKGYTDGLSFAIAETENEARRLAMDEIGYNGYRRISWGEVEVRPVSKCAYYVYGGD